MRQYFSLFCLGLCFLYCGAVCAEPVTKVKVVSRGDDNAAYAISMIRLGLQKSGIPFDLEIENDALSAPKLREELLAGNIDIIWTATNIDMEESSIPVRVPLFKGLLGHRILLIHKDNQHLFDSTMSFDQVLNFKYGQGAGWTDTTIMEANGMDVVKATKYEGLFHMTDGKRFDAFPRGVHEPWGEMSKRPSLDLAVDRNLMLVYKMPYYLFVSPGRPDLAQAIEKGLLAAIDDGSFDERFLSNPMVKMVIQNAGLSQRRIFNLKNPQLPPRTPLDNKKLWVDISTL